MIQNKSLEESLLEKLAEIEHKQWMYWSTSLLKSLGSRLPPDIEDRWQRCWVKYENLPDKIKEKNREWARKALAVFEELLRVRTEKIHVALERESCPHCGSDMVWHECEGCGGERYSHHECGEDTCCCLYPVPNVECDWCDGKGGWWICLSKCKEEKEKEQ